MIQNTGVRLVCNWSADDGVVLHSDPSVSVGLYCFLSAPEGRSGRSDVSSLSWVAGLSFDSTSSARVLFLFLSYIFACLLAHSHDFFPSENSSTFFVKRQAFLYGICLAARRGKLVGGMCSKLPYGTGICCYAFIWFFFISYCFCSSLFLYSFFFKIWYW